MGWMDDITPKTQEFLAEFGEHFVKSFGVALFLKIKAEVEEGLQQDERKLKYRDWNSVPRYELLDGECWVKKGDGPGAFGGWTAYHVVEQQDYSLAFFKDAKTAASGDAKKAKMRIGMAGYSLETRPSEFYGQQARSLANELDCEPPEVAFSQFSWAVAHPLRTNFVMQLHRPATGGCACLGGSSVEPMDAGSENADKIEEWTSCIDGLIANGSPRDLESDATAMAFERAVQKMSQKHPSLDGFSDDGTESQILHHMAFLAVFEAACKSELQEEVKRSPIARLPLWLKGRAAASAAIERAVTPAWSGMQQQAAALAERTEPKIREGLEPIVVKKAEVTDKIKEAVGGKIGEAMASKLNPVLAPLIHAFDKPMRTGVEFVLKIYEEHMDKIFTDQTFTGELTSEQKLSLDCVARTSDAVSPLHEAAGAMLQPLEEIKGGTEAQGVLENFEPNEARQRCLQSLLELLDAAAFTTQELLKADAAGSVADVRDRVIVACRQDSDAVVRDATRDILVELLLAVLNKAVGDVVTPILDSIKALIPEDLQDILDVEAEYNSLLEITLGEALGKLVEEKYK